MKLTYTVDVNKFFLALSASEDEIKQSIAFVMDGLGFVLAVVRPLGMQYFTVTVEVNQNTSAIADAITQGFYNVGYTSALIIKQEAGVTSTNIIKESVTETVDALSPALAPVSRYVLFLAFGLAIIALVIFAMKGGKN
jgi:hypothetical protein